MHILGIETSCDETAVAIVSDDRKIHSHVLLSQIEEHMPYGGVVPEIAARAHMDALDGLVTQAMKEGGFDDFSKLDAIAVTAGPGLIGGVIVGVMTAKAIASVAKVPLIAVNHLEGHALVARLTDESIAFPFMLLLVSGGHCQILAVEGVGRYQLLGQTKDDALGEAFDKVAKMLGLGYPGGPQVEALARKGNPGRFNFPRPLYGQAGCDFSFSGLKTAVRQQIQALGNLTEQDVADVCASFQSCVAMVLKDRLGRGIEMFRNICPEGTTLVVSGGVAANQYLRHTLEAIVAEHGFRLCAPPPALCTDNAVKIAWAGIEKYAVGHTDGLDFAPKARWPLAG